MHPRDRILDAAFATFERKGVREGTMVDIADRAGMGRATLYRYFSSKDEVINALVVREARTLAVLLDEDLGTDGSEDPLLVFERGLITALTYLRNHPLLKRTLIHEPESILPFLTVHGRPALQVAVDFASPYIERAVKAKLIDPVDPRIAAEWAARILLSLLLTPSVVIDLSDPAQAAAFVRALLPKGEAR